MPDRIAMWVAEHRHVAMGSLLVAVAVAFSTWVTMASLPFGDQRITVIDLFGGGAYLLAASLLRWVC